MHFLLNECGCLSGYPDEPLRTMARLFGSLVQHGLVSNMTLDMFQDYVHEALCKPIGSKMCAPTRTRTQALTLNPNSQTLDLSPN